MRWVRSIGLCARGVHGRRRHGVGTANGVMACGSNLFGELGVGSLHRRNAPVTLREPPGTSPKPTDIVTNTQPLEIRMRA
jgi:hypothetical protein